MIEPMLGLLFLNLGELFSDANLIFKVFVLLVIISFVKQNLGDSPAAIVIALVFSYVVLFWLWPLFGTIYFIYMLLMVGFSGVLVDFFFVSGHGGGGGEATPVSSGVDVAKRAAQMGAMRRRPGR